MLKHILLVLTILFVCANGHARTALDFFKHSDAATPLLPALTRLDMADYYSSGIDHTSANNVKGEAKILSVADRSLRFVAGTDIECQLAVYTAGNDTVLVLIETFLLPQADSRINVYDRDWQPLTRFSMPQPKLGEWLTAEGKLNRSDVELLLPFLLVKAEANPDDGTLTLQHSMDKYFLDEAERAQVSNMLKPSLVYRFAGKSFKPQK